MIETPLVSIAVLNFNYAKFVTKALDSAANQIYPNIEILIVDDQSTDDSVEVIQNWIRNYKGNFSVSFVINDKNLGLSGSCNVILKNVKGKYFQLLDADDVLFPSKISKQVEIIERSKDIAVVYSNVTVIDEFGNTTNPDYCSRIKYDKNKMPQGVVKEQLLDFNFITVHSALINTTYAKDVGGFDETLVLQDYYMWLQLAEKYEFRFLNDCTGAYRIHSASMSNNIKTNPASVNSAITLKYRYYDRSNDIVRKKLAKNIQFAAVYLYQNKYSTSKKWLTVAFKLNPGFKTFLYFIAIRIGIPFSFFDRIKTAIR
ncbi:glycosyltransferase [soil metagenome]